MVEHSAVNRTVAGSSPAPGACLLSLMVKRGFCKPLLPVQFWPEAPIQLVLTFTLNKSIINKGQNLPSQQLTRPASFNYCAHHNEIG